MMAEFGARAMAASRLDAIATADTSPTVAIGPTEATAIGAAAAAAVVAVEAADFICGETHVRTFSFSLG
jgi:hypothetical protein